MYGGMARCPGHKEEEAGDEGRVRKLGILKRHPGTVGKDKDGAEFALFVTRAKRPSAQSSMKVTSANITITTIEIAGRSAGRPRASRKPATPQMNDIKVT
jgi:hypothetical protein